MHILGSPVQAAGHRMDERGNFHREVFTRWRPGMKHGHENRKFVLADGYFIFGIVIPIQDMEPDPDTPRFRLERAANLRS